MLHPVGMRVFAVPNSSRSSNKFPAASAAARQSSLLNSRLASRHASLPVSSSSDGTSGGAGGGDKGGGDGLTATSHTMSIVALDPTMEFTPTLKKTRF